MYSSARCDKSWKYVSHRNLSGSPTYTCSPSLVCNTEFEPASKTLQKGHCQTPESKNLRAGFRWRAVQLELPTNSIVAFGSFGKVAGLNAPALPQGLFDLRKATQEKDEINLRIEKSSRNQDCARRQWQKWKLGPSNFEGSLTVQQRKGRPGQTATELAAEHNNESRRRHKGGRSTQNVVASSCAVVATDSGI